MAKYQVETEDGIFEVETEDSSLIGDSLKFGVKSAIDPFLRNYQQDTTMNQARENNAWAREKVLNSNVPLFGAGLRKNISSKPVLNGPIVPANYKSLLNTVSPGVSMAESALMQPKNEIVKQMQGLGLDVLSDSALAYGPSIGKKALTGLSDLSEDAGARFMNFYIKPRQAGYTFGKNPGRGVVKHIGPQINRESLLNSVDSKIDDLLTQLSEKLKGANRPVEVTGIVNAYKKNLQEMANFPETFSGPIEAHRSFGRDMDNLLSKISMTGPDGKIYVSPESAVDIKRALGKIPSWNTQDPKLGSIAKTSREAYGAFDKSIDEAVPGSSEVNSDISDLIGAKQGLQAGVSREQGKLPFGAPEAFAGIAAGGGNPFTPTGLIAAGTVKAMRSAPFNTTMGSVLGRGAKAGREGARLLESMERPTILSEIFKKFKTGQPYSGPPGTMLPKTSTVYGEGGFTGSLDAPIPSGPEPLDALGVSRQYRVNRLQDMSSGPTIIAPGRGPAIELPDYTETGLEPFRKELGISDFPRNVRSSTDVFSKGKITNTKDQKLIDRLIRIFQDRNRL